MKRKLLALFLLLTLALTACGAPAAPAPAATPAPAGQDIVVLYTNDVHCGVDDGVGYKGLAALKDAMTDAGNAVLLVDAGDALQGDLIGTLSQGAYPLQIMNDLGYDAAVPGNHEFDYGMEQFFDLTEQADFPYLSANFVDAEVGAVLDPYLIVEAAGVKLAFVGVCTPCTIASSTPAYFQNEDGEFIYGFRQDATGAALYSAVQAAVDAARGEGARYVVALTHLGTELDCSPWTSSEVINNTTGIDAVLDGHSHTVLAGELVKNKDGDSVLLSSTGTRLANVGCLTISPDGGLRSYLISDNGVGEQLADIQAEYKELTEQVVAATDVSLTTTDPAALGEDGKPLRIVRSQETNMGDLCADAYRLLTGADVAFVNGGGIRADIPAGDVTYGDIVKVSPYNNAVCVVEATGQELLDALELGVSRLPGESGDFLQVSGLCYEVDVDVPSPVQLDENKMFVGIQGQRRITAVTVGGEPIDPAATYTLASHDYLLFNNDYTMFKDNVVLQDRVMLDNQALIRYITELLGGVVGQDYADPYGQGRITIHQSAQ